MSMFSQFSTARSGRNDGQAVETKCLAPRRSLVYPSESAADLDYHCTLFAVV